MQVGQVQQVYNTRLQGDLSSGSEQISEITLKNGRDLNEKPSKTTKEVDAELTSQPIENKVADNSRKFEYSKTKIVEQVKEIPPLLSP